MQSGHVRSHSCIEMFQDVRFESAMNSNVSKIDMGLKIKGFLLNDDRFPKNFAFFLSVRPSDFALIVDQLAQENLLNEEQYWRRVLIEKPFGANLKSAIELQLSISKHLKETQIYRTRHTYIYMYEMKK